MSYDALPLITLIEQFAALPGIGRKSAQRLAFHILTLPQSQVEAFSSALLEARHKITHCECCKNFTDQPLCGICQDPTRDASVICVVEDPKDIVAFERSKEYRGTYHVLHGLISPMDGIGPDQIFVRELLARIGKVDQPVAEVVLATNPTVEGEATAMYLAGLLKPLGPTVSRLAFGIPVGASLEYVDDVTLFQALQHRNPL